MEHTGKKCGFLKSVARYNVTLLAEIAGPATGFDGLRAKRISISKGRLLMWERGFEDVYLDDGECQFLRVAGYNFPILKTTNGIWYGTYVDVLIDGKVNRIQVRTAFIPSANGPKKGSEDARVPIVAGWVKDAKRPRDVDGHFDDPICPLGYEPVIKGYAMICTERYNDYLKELGISEQQLGHVDYIRENPYLFNSLDSAPAEATPSVVAASETSAAPRQESPAPTPEANGEEAAQLMEMKKLLDAGLITQADYDKKKNAILFGKAKNGKGHGLLLGLFWYGAVCMPSGFLVNIIIGLAVWSAMSAQFVCPQYGYFAGFIVAGTGLIIALSTLPVLFKVKKEEPENKTIKIALWGFVVCAVLMAILVGISFIDYGPFYNRYHY